MMKTDFYVQLVLIVHAKTNFMLSGNVFVGCEQVVPP